MYQSLIKLYCLASFPRILTLGFNLKSPGIAKKESMQLIMANESLFEQKRRGVH